jgi:glycosyltransferase involved in cell wall biosynthesis
VPFKVCLFSDHHICFNPRLWKEAFFYEKYGFEVVILSMWQSEHALAKDHEILKGHDIVYKPYLNLLPGGNVALKFFVRVRKRLAGEVQKIFKKGTAWAISYAPELMYQAALNEAADLYLECAFYAGRKLVIAGKKVSFDFEDWYSHDYLVPARPVKLLATLEKFALLNGLFCTTTSQAMASALNKAYGSRKNINVIYNGFSSTESGEAVSIGNSIYDHQKVRLLWFSRTIGRNRGIEYLLKALAGFQVPVELHLLGETEEGYQEYLDGEFTLLKNHSLVIHPFLAHDQLLPFIAQFETGLAIEENINDNRKLTITNKILQYLQAGLQVIASDTAGQKEVAALFPASITLVNIHSPLQLQKAIASSVTAHRVKQQEQQQKFNNIFSWEAQEKKLKTLVEAYL